MFTKAKILGELLRQMQRNINQVQVILWIKKNNLFFKSGGFADANKFEVVWSFSQSIMRFY